MNNLREIASAEGLGFDKMIEPQTGEQLIPVIVVDSLALATDGLAAIRMQGYANREAVDMTFAKKQVTFYSRTTQGLWTKGEESGNLLRVRAVYTDCDADSLLIDAEPTGPTCHTGTNSCFEVIPGSEIKAKVGMFDPNGYLASLATIKGRFDGMQAGEKPQSYTEKLLADQNARVKKVGSEVVELVREECRPDFDRARFICEAADLIYATEVIVAARGINFEEVLAELARRNQK